MPFPRLKKPAEPKPTAASPCCKILRAIVAKTVKEISPGTMDLAHSGLLFAGFVIFAPEKQFFAARALDTGPPAAYSFAELILQRSLLAHAPPARG